MGNYAIGILIGAALAGITIYSLTWLAKRFPIRDSRCCVCEYGHHHR